MAARTIGKPDLGRLRVRFGKDGRLAYLGHLEVINTVLRSVRRAGLPFSVGNGFAQRMRIQFSQALPVGAASRDEYYDLYLTEVVDVAEALGALKASTPQALAPTEAAYVGSRLPALEAWLTRSHWDVRLFGQGDAFCAEVLGTALGELREEGIIHFMRGDKPRSIGLDSTLVGWEVADGPQMGVWQTIDLKLDTRSSNLGALRPAVLLEAAYKRTCLEQTVLDSMRVQRMGQWHEAEDGTMVSPLGEDVLESHVVVNLA